MSTDKSRSKRSEQIGIVHHRFAGTSYALPHGRQTGVRPATSLGFADASLRQPDDRLPDVTDLSAVVDSSPFMAHSSVLHATNRPQMRAFGAVSLAAPARAELSHAGSGRSPSFSSLLATSIEAGHAASSTLKNQKRPSKQLRVRPASALPFTHHNLNRSTSALRSSTVSDAPSHQQIHHSDYNGPSSNPPSSALSVSDAPHSTGYASDPVSIITTPDAYAVSCASVEAITPPPSVSSSSWSDDMSAMYFDLAEGDDEDDFDDDDDLSVSHDMYVPSAPYKSVCGFDQASVLSMAVPMSIEMARIAAEDVHQPALQDASMDCHSNRIESASQSKSRFVGNVDTMLEHGSYNVDGTDTRHNHAQTLLTSTLNDLQSRSAHDASGAPRASVLLSPLEQHESQHFSSSSSSHLMDAESSVSSLESDNHEPQNESAQDSFAYDMRQRQPHKTSSMDSLKAPIESKQEYPNDNQNAYQNMSMPRSSSVRSVDPTKLPKLSMAPVASTSSNADSVSASFDAPASSPSRLIAALIATIVAFTAFYTFPVLWRVPSALTLIVGSYVSLLIMIMVSVLIGVGMTATPYPHESISLSSTSSMASAASVPLSPTSTASDTSSNISISHRRHDQPALTRQPIESGYTFTSVLRCVGAGILCIIFFVRFILPSVFRVLHYVHDGLIRLRIGPTIVFSVLIWMSVTVGVGAVWIVASVSWDMTRVVYRVVRRVWYGNEKVHQSRSLRRVKSDMMNDGRYRSVADTGDDHDMDREVMDMKSNRLRRVKSMPFGHMDSTNPAVTFAPIPTFTSSSSVFNKSRAMGVGMNASRSVSMIAPGTIGHRGVSGARRLNDPPAVMMPTGSSFVSARRQSIASGGGRDGARMASGVDAGLVGRRKGPTFGVILNDDIDR